MKKLQMGVIGCGDITKYMLYFAKFNYHIEIVGCVDLSIDRARKAASLFRGAKAFTDYREMISSLSVDAVYLAVPHFLHYPIMKELISHGIHVLCEKPITTKLEDALEILDLSKIHNIKVGINYQYRYDKACYRMAMAAQNGDFGQLYYGTCNIPWNRSEDYFQQSPWHASWEQAGGGTLITQGSHVLDILLWSFGSKPVSAMGTTEKVKFTDVEVEDLAMGTIKLANGALIQITSAMVATPEQPVTMHLYGSKGTAVYQGPNFSRTRFIHAKVPRYKLNTHGIHPLGRSLNAFVHWVLSDRNYNNAIENAIPVLASVLAIYKSAESQRMEKIQLPM